MKQKRLQAAYVGGPTALFEWHGFRLLTGPTFDPPGGQYENGPVVLEETIGPALAPEALGRLDVVLLSHDHHLDNLLDIPGPHGRVLRITETPAQHGPANLKRGAVTGFVVAPADAPRSAVYFSGDTVWFEVVAEVA